MPGIFTNKWFWIAVAAIIIIIIVNRNWYQISRLFQPTTVNLEPGEKIIDATRQVELEKIAQNLYDSIYGSSDDAAYDAALNLTDNELKYMSKFYRRSVTQDNWLYTDVDDEVFSPFNDRDKRLMSRLAAIGEKG